jgi:hypothetical protein
MVTTVHAAGVGPLDGWRVEAMKFLVSSLAVLAARERTHMCRPGTSSAHSGLTQNRFPQKSKRGKEKDAAAIHRKCDGLRVENDVLIVVGRLHSNPFPVPIPHHPEETARYSITTMAVAGDQTQRRLSKKQKTQRRSMNI